MITSQDFLKYDPEEDDALKQSMLESSQVTDPLKI